MANSTISACPAPFVDLSNYPPTGGFLPGRFCGAYDAELSCCLPCPLEQWTYSDQFEHNRNIAYWFNVPALVCQVLLLLTFAVLPEEKSHRHYMSVGLCVSLILLELSFIIPLGTKPNECYDAVTPNDMRSDLSCAWSGALLEAGAMAGTMWILLRSLWTHLRVCIDVKHTALYPWLANAIGWGVPAIFLAISLPITGVSYRLGTTCIPNQHNAFVTWFGWLIAFGCLAALIQCVTTGFCLWLYVRNFWQSGSNESTEISTTGLTADGQRRPSLRLGKRLAWRRVRRVLTLQWRSMAMSVLVIIETVYFGTIYVAAMKAVEADEQPANIAHIVEWSECLVFSGGNKEQCLDYAKVLGPGEDTVIASLFMSALIGIFTFALIVRWSMVVGWYELVTNPSLLRNQRIRNAAGASPQGKPSESMRQMSFPEAGDVAARHETTNWFDDDADEEDEAKEESRRTGNAGAAA